MRDKRSVMRELGRVYRHRVTIQQPTQIGRTPLGQPILEWVDVEDVRASIEPLRGREYWAARQISSEVEMRVRIRYRPNLNSNMRLLYNGRILELVSPPINPMENNIELELLCKEAKPSG